MENVIQDLLLRSFKTHSNKLALQQGDETLSYAQLDEHSSRIADFLQSSGITRGSFVGVFLTRRIDIIVAMVGVLKAGCVFVPLDAAASNDRTKERMRKAKLRAMLVDTNTPAVILSTCNEIGAAFLPFDNAKDFVGDRSDVTTYSPEDKVYVYFTSGSTGVPKAILGRNTSLHHFISWELNEFTINENDRFAQFTVPTFDVFLRDTLTPLCAGATIIIPEDTTIVSNERALGSWVEQNDISFIHIVPSLFKVLMANAANKFANLRHVLLAGEKLKPTVVKQWYGNFNKNTQLVNLYGPTETTLAKAFYRVTHEDANAQTIPVGKGIPGAKFIVLNEQLEICDTQEKGEVYILTPYMSFGYVGDEELNKKSFIPSPFHSDPNIVLYKTGDVGRLMTNGNLEILGRKDRQVKIRGIRVELEEIENLILKYDAVEEAIAVAAEDEDRTLIRLFITSSRLLEVELIENVWRYFNTNAPRHLVPQQIQVVDRIPRTINGKVDLEKLKKSMPATQRQMTLPTNPDQEALLSIWKKVLNFDSIGINDRFYEVGGNSLNVMSLLYEINQHFNVRIDVDVFFKNDTIELLSKQLNSADANVNTGSITVGEPSHYPLTALQIQILSSLEEKDPFTYHIINSFIIQGDAVASINYTQIINGLVQRHDALRTYFDHVDGLPVQRILTTGTVEIIELGPGGSDKIDFKPHDLYTFPLFRFYVERIDPSTHRVTIDIHHLISDALSQDILMKEFFALIKGDKLDELPMQFKDYVAWEQRDLQGSNKNWLNEFENTAVTINFPASAVQSRNADGAVYELDINPESYNALKQFAQESNLTLFNILFATYFVLLNKISGQNKIAVASPVSVRHDPRFKQVVGPLFNMMAIPADVSSDLTFVDFVKMIRDKVSVAQQGTQYRLDTVLQQVYEKANHEVNTMFAYDVYQAPVTINSLLVEPVMSNKTAVKYPFYLEFLDMQHHGTLAFKFDRNLFDEATVERFASYYNILWNTWLGSPSVKLNEVDLPHDFNRVAEPSLTFGFNI